MLSRLFGPSKSNEELQKEIRDREERKKLEFRKIYCDSELRFLYRDAGRYCDLDETFVNIDGKVEAKPAYFRNRQRERCYNAYNDLLEQFKKCEQFYKR